MATSSGWRHICTSRRLYLVLQIRMKRGGEGKARTRACANTTQSGQADEGERGSVMGGREARSGCNKNAVQTKAKPCKTYTPRKRSRTNQWQHLMRLANHSPRHGARECRKFHAVRCPHNQMRSRPCGHSSHSQGARPDGRRLEGATGPSLSVTGRTARERLPYALAELLVVTAADALVTL